MSNLDYTYLLSLTDSKWKRQLADSFKDPKKLLEFLNIDLEETNKYFGKPLFEYDFPFLITRHFVSLMQKENIHDKLLMQVLPFTGELRQQNDFVLQPLAEDNFKPQPNIIHKYNGRLLFLPKGACAINCRYCFRRNFPYENLDVGVQAIDESLEYIYSNNIDEVILSGGDPLMMTDKEFLTLASKLVEKNNQLSQEQKNKTNLSYITSDLGTKESKANYTKVRRLRIHTRLPVVLPQRINGAFLAICKYLQENGIRVCIVFHINHAQEISQELVEVTKKLAHSGITLLNQSVLLAHINDTLQEQQELAYSLYEANILPYYLHLFDKVAGAVHFYIPDAQAEDLYQQMQKTLPGYLLPRLAREEVGKDSKTLIIPSLTVS